MARTTPTVRNEVLTLFTDGYEQQIAVGSSTWYAWLEEVSTFVFVGNSGTFTAHKEPKQRGSAYWRAYRKRDGQLHRAYLGRSGDLTIDRLQTIAIALAATQKSDTLSAIQRNNTQVSHRSGDSSDATIPVIDAGHSMPEAQFPSHRATQIKTRPYSLPISPNALIGREQEWAVVFPLVSRSDVRLITLSGTGGVGKTRLALEVASATSTVFPDGVCLVPLASIRHADQVMQAIAQALGLWEAGDRPLVEQVQDALRDRHLLLLLDNFEQVIEAGPQLAHLLANCPHLKFLVTSRAALRISFEYEFTVPPLKAPDLKRSYTDEDLAQVAAVRLFIKRAQAIQPTFQLTHDNLHAIAEICIRLDGLPLAIELAAARIRLLPPQALLKRLSHRLKVLTNGARDLPSRQHTLRNTIQWSYDLLDVHEQRLFRSLSIFVDGCTLEAAVAIAKAIEQVDNAHGSQDIEVLDVCASLLDKHLVQQATQGEEEPRFLMLETIREYGLECLQACGELEAVQRTHAAYFLQLAVEAYGHLFQAEAVQWFQRLEQEYANLRTALLWALEHEAEKAGSGIELATQLSCVLWRFWTVRGHLSEGRTMLERVLAASEGSRDEMRAKLLLTLGTILWHQNDFARMGELIWEQLHLCQKLGDLQGVAHTLIGLSGLARQQHDYGHARALAEESLAISRTLGDSWRAAVALSLLGRLASAEGEHGRAKQELEESLMLYRKLGYPGDIAWPLIYLARDAIAQGEHEHARCMLEEALALCRKVGDKWGLALALSFLGQEALELDDVRRANTLLSECQLLNQELGDLRSMAWSCFLLASVFTLEGETAAARSLYEQGLGIASTLAHEGLIASCLQGLATVMNGHGQFRSAARLWGAAEALRPDSSSSLPSLLRVRVAQAQATARAKLGDAVFAHAWAEGRVMGPEKILMTQEAAIPPTLVGMKGPFNDSDKAFSTYAVGLTSRELEVLRLVAQGLTDAQVAAQLVISLRTVTTHLTSIYLKLGVGSRAAATRFAVEHHLL